MILSGSRADEGQTGDAMEKRRLYIPKRKSARADVDRSFMSMGNTHNVPSQEKWTREPTLNRSRPALQVSSFDLDSFENPSAETKTYTRWHSRAYHKKLAKVVSNSWIVTLLSSRWGSRQPVGLEFACLARFFFSFTIMGWCSQAGNLLMLSDGQLRSQLLDCRR